MMIVCVCVCVRDVSSAGLVIAHHQDIKAEIEARSGSFIACNDMGRALIDNNHYASDEVHTRAHTHTQQLFISSLSLTHTHTSDYVADP